MIASRTAFGDDCTPGGASGPLPSAEPVAAMVEAVPGAEPPPEAAAPGAGWLEKAKLPQHSKTHNFRHCNLDRSKSNRRGVCNPHKVCCVMEESRPRRPAEDQGWA